MSRVYIPREQLSEEEENQLVKAAEDAGFEVDEHGILLKVDGLESSQAKYLVDGLKQMGVQHCWRSDR